MHFAARFYLYYTQPDFSICQKVINYANIVLGTNASQYLRDWAALEALISQQEHTAERLCRCR